MKVIGYTALHYGREYFGHAVKSVIDHVDEFYVLYSPVGSHGTRTDVPCPETRAELLALAKFAAGNKLRWIDGTWTSEGSQRDTIHHAAPDATLTLVIDADEVWPDGLAEKCINRAISSPDISRWRVPMIHYWRSFYRAVLHDPAFPERVIRGNGRGSVTETIAAHDTPINHLGYALKPDIVDYKWKIHGHLGQYRTDCDWFHDKYLANAQQDCHPVGSQYWNPEDVDPWLYMPAFMRQHEYAYWGVIGDIAERVR